MKYIRDLEDYTGKLPSVVTIGKFDGLHRGHQLLMQRVRDLSDEGFISICFTFDRQPRTLIKHEQVPLIMTPEELHEELNKRKVDVLLECPFTEEIRHMEPEEFVENVLCKKLNMKFLVVGDDFKLGYKGKGTCDFLIDHAQQLGYEMNVVKCETFEGEKISSSMIREKIRNGQISTANYLLGHSYKFEGKVVEGKHIGHKMGIPTLNIIPDERKVLPPKGVYAAICTFPGKDVLKGIANLGVNPTIADNNRTTLEMNLFDFDSSIYEQDVEISLLEFIRPERRFDSIDALREQVLKDIEKVKDLFSK